MAHAAAHHAAHHGGCAIADRSPTVILGFDEAFNCTYANHAATHLVGVPRGELTGLGWRAAIHPDDLAAFDDWVARDICNGVLSPHEHRGITRSGDVAWCRARMAVIRDGGGRVTGYVGVWEDITDARAAADALRRLARTDELTGLANRTALFERLGELTRGPAAAGSLAVLCVDVDRFKDVNDTRGHTAGDAVLAQVGRRISEVVGRAGTVGRLGGDEFVVLVTDVAGPRAVIRLTERVLGGIRVPIVVGEAEFVLSASAGIAFIDRAAAGDLSGAIGDADIALRRVKDLGGDGYEIFDEQMRRVLSGRLEMEAGLRRAVERNEFVLHYQPELSADGRLNGFEALIRWDHPTLGRIPPSEFIPIAEESGLIVAIGRWALFEACDQAARWMAMRGGAGGARPLLVSVNLSAIQLRSRNLVETVAAALARSRLDGECLCLEITESVIMEDAASVVPVLEGLRALGVQLAIDDFGTGYSSLGYLSELPVDFIKIDRRFVEGIGVRSPSQNIVRAVIGLAHALDLRVIAEGIELPGQLEWLRRHGCDVMQGYHLGRPGPAAQYDPLVQRTAGARPEPRPGSARPEPRPIGGRLEAV